jgi:tetratricopeptide (TPR) repeat protein
MKRQKIIAKAQKHALKGRHSKAIALYTKLVESDPKDVRSWLRIADLQHKSGEYDEAVKTYLKVAEHYTSDGFALKAIAVYRKAVEVPTAPTEIHLRLAELFGQHGLKCDAMKHLEAVVGHFSNGPVRLAAQRQMVSIQPNDPTHRVALGDTYLNSGLQPQAVYCYEKAAELHRFALELTAPDSGQTDALIALLERIVQLKEDSREEVQELARLYGRPAMLLDTRISSDDAAEEFTSEEELALEAALRDELRGLLEVLPSEQLQGRVEACQADYQPGAAALEAIEIELDAELPDHCVGMDRAMASMATVIEPDDAAASDRRPATAAPVSIEIPVEIVPPLSDIDSDDELIFLDQLESEASFDSVVIPGDGPAASDVVALDPAAYAVPTGHDDLGLTPEPALPLEGDVMPGAHLLEPTPDLCPLDPPDVDALALTPEPALCAVPTGDLHHQEIPWHRMDTNHDRELPDSAEIRNVIFPRIKLDMGSPPLLPRGTSPGYCEVGPAEETLPGLPELLGLADLPDGDDLERAFERIAQPGSMKFLEQTQVGLPPSMAADQQLGQPDVEVPAVQQSIEETPKPEPKPKLRSAPSMESRQRQRVLARFVDKVDSSERTDPKVRLSRKIRQLACKAPDAHPERKPEQAPQKRAIAGRRRAADSRTRAPTKISDAPSEKATNEMASAMLRSGLQKVDHFLKRNLLQDAEAILKDLAHVSPDDPEVEDRLAELYSRELSTMVRSLPA